MEWSVSKLVRVEGGTVGISKADLEALLRHYGVEDKKRTAYLVGLAREARSSGWWDEYKIKDRAFCRYIGYEAGASSIRMAQGLLVPGILQTEAYARLIAAAYSPEEDVPGVVNLRKKRQERISARKPDQEHILDEAVIRRHVGDAMPEQLRHLIELSDRPEITIRVIPFTKGPHFGMRGPFTILGFDVGLEDVVYLESARRGDLLIGGADGETVTGQGGAPIDLIEEIAKYRSGFARLGEIALEPEASRKLIEQVAYEMT